MSQQPPIIVSPNPQSPQVIISPIPQSPQVIIVGQQGPPGAALNWVGQWEDDVEYDPFDVVGFDGSSYLCLNQNIDEEPPDFPDDWQLVAAAGQGLPLGGTTGQIPYKVSDNDFDFGYETLDTSIVPENGNLYFTEDRTRDTVLTGLVTDAGEVTEEDSILTGIGKLVGNAIVLVGLLGGFAYANAPTTYAVGDTFYGVDGSNAIAALSANASETKMFLSSQADKNGNPQPPLWSVVTKEDVGLPDVENIALSSWPGSDQITTLGTITTGSIPLMLTTGTLALNRGGTGQTTQAAAFNALSPLTALGDLLYGGTAGTGTRLAPNTTATRKFLLGVGTGSAGQAPSWTTLAAGDIPDLSGTYQPLSANLTALAGLSTTGIVARTGTNTYTPRTITGTTGQITLTNGDGVSGNPTISLPGTITQGTTFSNGLTANTLTVSGLTITRIPYMGTGGLFTDSANFYRSTNDSVVTGQSFSVGSGLTNTSLGFALGRNFQNGGMFDSGRHGYQFTRVGNANRLDLEVYKGDASLITSRALSVDDFGNVAFGVYTWSGLLTVGQYTTGIGTVSNLAGGTTVTGVGTQFLNTFRLGQTITIGGQTVTITAIANNLSMTTTAITNANSGVAYTLTGGTRLTVKGNGFAGINTDTPVGAWTVDSTSYTDGILSRATAAGGAGFGIQNLISSGHTYYFVSTGASNDPGVGALGIYDFTDGAYRMVIKPTNGNVGFGTVAPIVALHIQRSDITGSDVLAPQILADNPATASGGSACFRARSGTGYSTYPEIWMEAQTGSGGVVRLRGVSNHDLQIRTNDVTRLTILKTGEATFSSTCQSTGFIANQLSPANTSLTLKIRGGAGTTAFSGLSIDPSAASTITAGVHSTMEITANSSFTPTSGTGVFNSLLLSPVINQTGGANGITRAVYINPTVTAAADFRALEVATGKTVLQALSATTYSVGATAGVDGTFTTVDLKTVTVTKGIITAIV